MSKLLNLGPLVLNYVSTAQITCVKTLGVKTPGGRGQVWL